ncbi:MAG: hypothetical protein WCC04_07695 [Terriglobales bacterium]
MNRDDKNREQEADRLIDEALGQYAKVEPREGLERRVLASLAEARRDSSHRLRWWNALAFSAAAILALALLWRGRTEPARFPANPVAKVVMPQQTEEHKAESEHSVDGNQRSGNAGANSQGQESHSLAAHSKPDRGIRMVAEHSSATPKLEQFPAPQPLSEQEQLLVRYVEQFPRRAALMARAQTELHKEDERDMAGPWSNANSATQEQQE